MKKVRTAIPEEDKLKAELLEKLNLEGQRVNALRKVLSQKVNITFFDDTILATSGRDTYQVKMKRIGSEMRWTCTCGDKYKDFDRNHCKHILAVILKNFNDFTSAFMKKDSSKYINELFDVNKMFSNMKTEPDYFGMIL
jgi:uncharacterized Zn finger protein